MTNPGLNITQNFTEGLHGATSNYDPATGQLTLTLGSIEGPKSFGFYDLTVDDNGVQSKIIIYIIDCCLVGLPIDVIVINQPISSLMLGGTLNGLTLLVLDDLVIDEPTVFNTCKAYFGAEARMTVLNGNSLAIDNTLLSNYCDYRWDGVLATGQNIGIEIYNSEIRGSGRGFYLEDDVSLICTNNHFVDNTASISFMEYTLNGNYYNNSRTDLTGNLFELPLNRIDFTHNSVIRGIVNLLNFGNNFVYINCVNSDKIQIGRASYSKNEFKDQDAIGILGHSSTFFVENNLFDNVAQSINAVLCSFRVGGKNSTYQNDFKNGSELTSYLGNQSIKRNLFFESYCKIEDPYNYLIDGIFGTKIDSNLFTNSELDIYSNLYPILTGVNVTIQDNNFYDAYTTIRNIETTSLTQGILITDNFFGSGVITNPQRARLKLTKTPGVRIGYNNFRDIPGPPIGGTTWGNPGIELDNVTGAQIKNNYFELNYTAIYGTNDLSNTVISCNTFDGCHGGMSFKDAILTDFGSPTGGVENTFNSTPGTSAGNIILWSAPGSSFIWTPFNYYFTSIAAPGSTWYTDPAFVGGGGVPNYLGASFPFASFNSSGYLMDCGILNKAILDVKQHQLVKLFPNPCTNGFRVEHTKDDSIERLELYSINGIKIDVIANDIGYFEIDLPNGLYISRIYFQSGLLIEEKLFVNK